MHLFYKVHSIQLSFLFKNFFFTFYLFIYVVLELLFQWVRLANNYESCLQLGCHAAA